MGKWKGDENMKNKIIEMVYENFIKNWTEKNAISDAPKLFPYIEPSEEVRKAVEALECRTKKDQRVKELTNFTIRVEKVDKTQRSQNPFFDMTIRADPEKIYEEVYGECKNCTYDRDICNRAFSIVTEYTSNALKKLRG